MTPSDDIVTRLRDQRDEDGCCVICGHGRWEFIAAACLRCEAADEIERLRTALQLAVGELSTHDTHRLCSPDQLYQQFLEEVRRG